MVCESWPWPDYLNDPPSVMGPPRDWGIQDLRIHLPFRTSRYEGDSRIMTEAYTDREHKPEDGNWAYATATDFWENGTDHNLCIKMQATPVSLPSDRVSQFRFDNWVWDDVMGCWKGEIIE